MLDFIYSFIYLTNAWSSELFSIYFPKLLCQVSQCPLHWRDIYYWGQWHQCIEVVDTSSSPKRSPLMWFQLDFGNKCWCNSAMKTVCVCVCVCLTFERGWEQQPWAGPSPSKTGLSWKCHLGWPPQSDWSLSLSSIVFYPTSHRPVHQDCPGLIPPQSGQFPVPL